MRAGSSRSSWFKVLLPAVLPVVAFAVVPALEAPAQEHVQAAGASQPIGRITAAFGHTAIWDANGQRAVDLHAAVSNDNRIVTNGGGVSILLASRVVLKVDPASAICVREGAGETNVVLEYGTVHVFVGDRPADSGVVAVQDPHGRAETAKGVFLASYDAESRQAYYACEHTSLTVKGKRDVVGITLGPDQQAVVNNGQLTTSGELDRLAFLDHKRSLDQLGQSVVEQGATTFRLRSRMFDTDVAITQLDAAGWISKAEIVRQQQARQAQARKKGENTESAEDPGSGQSTENTGAKTTTVVTGPTADSTTAAQAPAPAPAAPAAPAAPSAPVAPVVVVTTPSAPAAPPVVDVGAETPAPVAPPAAPPGAPTLTVGDTPAPPVVPDKVDLGIGSTPKPGGTVAIDLGAGTPDQTGGEGTNNGRGPGTGGGLTLIPTNTDVDIDNDRGGSNGRRGGDGNRDRNGSRRDQGGNSTRGGGTNVATGGSLPPKVDIDLGGPPAQGGGSNDGAVSLGVPVDTGNSGGNRGSNAGDRTSVTRSSGAPRINIDLGGGNAGDRGGANRAPAVPKIDLDLGSANGAPAAPKIDLGGGSTPTGVPAVSDGLAGGAPATPKIDLDLGSPAPAPTDGLPKADLPAAPAGVPQAGGDLPVANDLPKAGSDAAPALPTPGDVGIDTSDIATDDGKPAVDSSDSVAKSSKAKDRARNRDRDRDRSRRDRSDRGGRNGGKSAAPDKATAAPVAPVAPVAAPSATPPVPVPVPNPTPAPPTDNR